MTDSPPNIVLIMCDQMRWDAAGFAGSSIVQTPHMDRLAEGGVCFENAYCASPVCSPAGPVGSPDCIRMPHLQLRNYGPIGGSQFDCYLPQYHIAIGDVLKGAGYRCGLVGPWHLGEGHRSQHGFTDCWHIYRYLGDGYTDPLFDYFKQEGVPNLYLAGAERMTLYGDTLAFGTITDPRQQRTTWTVEGGIEFLQQKHDAPFSYLRVSKIRTL